MKDRNTRIMLALAYAMAVLGGASFGLVLPVLPDLLASVGALDRGAAAQMGGLLIAAFAMTQLVAAPVFGALSDAYGRKPVLIFALITGVSGHVAMALAPSLGLLIAGRALTGLSAAAFAAFSAMIADRIEPERRATVFGRLSAADGAGLVAGPAFVGFLAEYSLRAPFILVAGFEALLLVAIIALLRETLSPDNRRPVAWSDATPFKTLRMVSSIPRNKPIFLAFGLFSLGFISLPIMWAYFSAVRFDWGPAEVGCSMSILGLATIGANGFLLPFLRRLMSDKAILWMTFIMGPVLMIWLAANENATVLYVLVVLLAQACTGFAILEGLLSANTPADFQGGLQGGMGVIDSTTSIIAPFLYPWIFALALSISPTLAGAPFVAGAIIIAAGALFLNRVASTSKILTK